MKLVPITELFDIKRGSNLDLNALEETENGVPYVSCTARNNGVLARVASVPDVALLPAGALSVPLVGNALEAFLQEEPFYSAQNIAVLTPLEAMTRDVLLYYATCLRANRFRYSYGRKANRTMAQLKVPALSELPDYVRRREPTAVDVLAEASLPPPSIERVDTANWRPFKYTDLFTIVRGQGPSLADAREAPGPTPYVTASEKNNGIATWTASAPKHPARCLTVATNGSVGECFFQPDAFSASSDVAVLQSKTPLSAEALLFIATLVRREGKLKYGYGRKWGLQRMAESVIRLPVDDSGKPDVDSMSAVIQACPSYARIRDSIAAKSEAI